MHLFAPEVGMMGTSGIVGPCILQAAGAGYSFKLLESDRVAVAFFGDGAVNNGAFHEGLNLASIWKLPVLFVCENNEFATEVPFQYAAGNPGVAGRRRVLRHARHRGRRQRRVGRLRGRAARRSAAPDAAAGATLIECKTYRTRPHAEGMGDYTYRTREEVEHWKTRCPIQRLRRMLVEESLAGEAELERIDERGRVARSSRPSHFAESSAWPDPATAADHVYAEPPVESRRRSPSATRRRKPAVAS